jgi:hypothetical protein
MTISRLNSRLTSTSPKIKPYIHSLKTALLIHLLLRHRKIIIITKNLRTSVITPFLQRLITAAATTAATTTATTTTAIIITTTQEPLIKPDSHALVGLTLLPPISEITQEPIPLISPNQLLATGTTLLIFPAETQVSEELTPTNNTPILITTTIVATVTATTTTGSCIVTHRLFIIDPGIQLHKLIIITISNFSQQLRTPITYRTGMTTTTTTTSTVILTTLTDKEIFNVCLVQLFNAN